MNNFIFKKPIFNVGDKAFIVETVSEEFPVLKAEVAETRVEGIRQEKKDLDVEYSYKDRNGQKWTEIVFLNDKQTNSKIESDGRCDILFSRKDDAENLCKDLNEYYAWASQTH